MSGQEHESAQAEKKPQNEEEQAGASAYAAPNESQVEPADAATDSLVDDLEALRSQLEKEQELAQTNLDLARRAQAEMENLRKRTTRDIENAHKYALDKFVNELLPIVDSMELGMSAAASAEGSEELKKGMELTLKMFMTALEKFGVKQIAPEGEKFNPELHEAVSMQKVDGQAAGTVVSVMQKGYELNGRLVRPAMVMVAQ